jgi:hypothetical protein
MLFFYFAAVAAATAALLPGVFGAASTDEYRDADQLQSGYLPNHNMDPNVVNSASFGQLWRVLTGGSDTSAADGGGTEQYVERHVLKQPDTDTESTPDSLRSLWSTRL